MNPPDWPNCREEELWSYVAWHLEAAGIETVMVGGAVVAVYTDGIYQSGDIDLVPDDTMRDGIVGVLVEIGFARRGRHFVHPSCPQLFVEFPNGPVSIGEEFPIEPDERVVEGQRLKLLSPTDCVKDRLAAFIHWKARDCFDQAILVCRQQAARIDWGGLERWCAGEGSRGKEAFAELRAAMA